MVQSVADDRIDPQALGEVTAVSPCQLCIQINRHQRDLVDLVFHPVRNRENELVNIVPLTERPSQPRDLVAIERLKFADDSILFGLVDLNVGLRGHDHRRNQQFGAGLVAQPSMVIAIVDVVTRPRDMLDDGRVQPDAAVSLLRGRLFYGAACFTGPRLD